MIKPGYLSRITEYLLGSRETPPDATVSVEAHDARIVMGEIKLEDGPEVHPAIRPPTGFQMFLADKDRENSETP